MCKKPIPHTYVPSPPYPPGGVGKKKNCTHFFSLVHVFLALYDARYASNTCQIPTKRTRGEHLRATEGSWAWLHLTVDDVGTEFKHRTRGHLATPLHPPEDISPLWRGDMPLEVKKSL